MIRPPPTATRGLARQQWLQPGPFLIGQIMAMQHQEDLPHPALKIRGTRSSRRSHSGVMPFGHGGGFGFSMFFRLAGWLLKLTWGACVLVGDIAVGFATWVGRHVARLGTLGVRHSARRLDDDGRRSPFDRL